MTAELYISVQFVRCTVVAMGYSPEVLVYDHVRDEVRSVSTERAQWSFSPTWNGMVTAVKKKQLM